LASVDDEGVRAEAVAALAQADRLAATIDEMLALARAHANADLRSVDIAQLVADRANTWRATARRQHRSIDLRAATGCEVQVAAPALAQAIDALIDNALRHGSGTVHITVDRRPRHVEVTISDEGSGIPADAAETVFERHVSLHGGTGVGLALARSLVESSGGRLELTDARRARFRILLTTTRAQSPGDRSPVEASTGEQT
jgi:signal transduction histidine kinase